jgi:hypothetical protein
MLKVISLVGAALWIVSWSAGSAEARWSGDYLTSSVQELRAIEVKDDRRCWHRKWLSSWLLQARTSLQKRPLIDRRKSPTSSGVFSSSFSL